MSNIVEQMNIQLNAELVAAKEQLRIFKEQIDKQEIQIKSYEDLYLESIEMKLQADDLKAECAKYEKQVAKLESDCEFLLAENRHLTFKNKQLVEQLQEAKKLENEKQSAAPIDNKMTNGLGVIGDSVGKIKKSSNSTAEILKKALTNAWVPTERVQQQQSKPAAAVSEDQPTSPEDPAYRTRSIMVANLYQGLSTHHVEEYFKNFGRITNVTVPSKTCHLPEGRKYLFLKFADPASAEKAVAIKYHTVYGVSLIVNKGKDF